MIDTHAHLLYEFYDDIDTLVEELKDKNMLKIINCADSISTSKEVLDSYKKYDDFLLPAVGIHPQNIDSKDDIDKLDEIIKNIIIKLESKMFYLMVLLGVIYISVSSTFFILRSLGCDVDNLGVYLAVLFSIFGAYITKLIKSKDSDSQKK